jgi:hypothetical protein
METGKPHLKLEIGGHVATSFHRVRGDRTLTLRKQSRKQTSTSSMLRCLGRNDAYFNAGTRGDCLTDTSSAKECTPGDMRVLNADLNVFYQRVTGGIDDPHSRADDWVTRSGSVATR